MILEPFVPFSCVTAPLLLKDDIVENVIDGDQVMLSEVKICRCSCSGSIKAATLLAMIENITSNDRSFGYPIIHIDTTHFSFFFHRLLNNALHNKAHSLFIIPYLAIIASKVDTLLAIIA